MLVRISSFVGVAGLVTSAAVAASSREAEKVLPDGQKVICRAVEQTGSLVRKTKRCYTRVQWDRIAEAARANGQRIAGDHSAGLITN